MQSRRQVSVHPHFCLVSRSLHRLRQSASYFLLLRTDCPFCQPPSSRLRFQKHPQVRASASVQRSPGLLQSGAATAPQTTRRILRRPRSAGPTRRTTSFRCPRHLQIASCAHHARLQRKVPLHHRD